MKNGNFDFRGFSLFLQVYEKRLQATQKKKMECWYSDGFASYLKQNFAC